MAGFSPGAHGRPEVEVLFGSAAQQLAARGVAERAIRQDGSPRRGFWRFVKNEPSGRLLSLRVCFRMRCVVSQVRPPCISSFKISVRPQARYGVDGFTPMADFRASATPGSLSRRSPSPRPGQLVPIFGIAFRRWSGNSIRTNVLFQKLLKILIQAEFPKLWKNSTDRHSMLQLFGFLVVRSSSSSQTRLRGYS